MRYFKSASRAGGQYDPIVLDVMLPETDGLKVVWLSLRYFITRISAANKQRGRQRFHPISPNGLYSISVMPTTLLHMIRGFDRVSPTRENNLKINFTNRISTAVFLLLSFNRI